MCQASSGTAHGRCPNAVTTFSTTLKARLRRARPGHARPASREGTRKSAGGIVGWSAMRPPRRARGVGGRAYSGAAACRALRAEAHRARRCRGSAAPHPQASGTGSNALSVPAPARAGRGGVLTPNVPVAVRRSRSRNAAHCPGRPLRTQGHPKILSNAPQKASSGPALACGASADPAGLTARARPEARPGRRAANLTRTVRMYRETRRLRRIAASFMTLPMQTALR
jgi:hypothetical protein